MKLKEDEHCIEQEKHFQKSRSADIFIFLVKIPISWLFMANRKPLTRPRRDIKKSQISGPH
tara:strand:+ start:194 stop:376 length:183 start_codon:yes stop_codon:yes gene_type:complete